MQESSAEAPYTRPHLSRVNTRAADTSSSMAGFASTSSTPDVLVQHVTSKIMTGQQDSSSTPATAAAVRDDVTQSSTTLMMNSGEGTAGLGNQLDPITTTLVHSADGSPRVNNRDPTTTPRDQVSVTDADQDGSRKPSTGGVTPISARRAGSDVTSEANALELAPHGNKLPLTTPCVYNDNFSGGSKVTYYCYTGNNLRI